MVRGPRRTHKGCATCKPKHLQLGDGRRTPWAVLRRLGRKPGRFNRHDLADDFDDYAEESLTNARESFEATSETWPTE